MQTQQAISHSPLLRLANFITILGSIAILSSLTFDIVKENTYLLPGSLLDLHLVICLIFIVDFFAWTLSATRKWRFFFNHIFLLLVSIPYLNIMNFLGIELSKSSYIFLKCLPLLRGMVGIYYVVLHFSRSRLHSLMLTYIFIIIALSYLAALFFYAYENGVNPALHGFGNALWWAGMNITTVGASIFPVTAMGKTLAVILPGLGMIFFPLFTVYVTSLLEQSDRCPSNSATEQKD